MAQLLQTTPYMPGMVGVTVDSSTSSIISLLSVLAEGSVTSNKETGLKEVGSVAISLGINFENWQIGRKKSKQKSAMELVNVYKKPSQKDTSLFTLVPHGSKKKAKKDEYKVKKLKMPKKPKATATKEVEELIESVIKRAADVNGNNDSKDKDPAAAASASGIVKDDTGLFVCPHCGKSIAGPLPAFKRHLCIHLGVKYTCHLCEKSFSRKDNLNLHMRQKHNSQQSVAGTASFGEMQESPNLTNENVMKKDDIVNEKMET